MKKKLLALFLSVCLQQAYGLELKKVCASVQTNFSWSQSSPLTIMIESGMELRKSQTYNPNIKLYAYYAFIIWNEYEATVVELTSPYVPGGMMFHTEGFDDEGRKWRFTDNTTGYCF